MAIRFDLTGQEFERLTVLEYAGQDKHGVSLWICRCTCGVVKVINSMGLKAKKVKSCGCHRAEQLRAGREGLVKQRTRHGRSRTTEHHIWANILYRCQKETSRQYPDYGGRGIKVCERWQGEDGFINFLADMGPRPSPQHTIDRINNDGNYEPGNCRWATKKEQARNRRDNLILEYRGKRKTMIEWCEIKGINKITLWGRLAKGWSVDDALDTPIDVRFRKK